MVQGIPIFKVTLSEGLFNEDADSNKLFAYAIEANKGPIGEPIYVASADEAKRIFGVNFAPHFYQGGSGLVLYRVAFKDAKAPSIVCKAYTRDYTAEELSQPGEKETIDLLKVTSVRKGTPKHKINLSKSMTSSTAYNLTVTIDGVGSKKYQNISSLNNVAKRINNKFAEYIKAEVLVDEEELIEGGYTPARLAQDKDEKGNIIDTLSGGSNGKLLKTNGQVSDVEIPDIGLNDNKFTKVTVVTNDVASFVGQSFYIDGGAKPDNETAYPLYTDVVGTEAGIYVTVEPNESEEADYKFVSYEDEQKTKKLAEGTVKLAELSDEEPNVATTLLYAYREAFEMLEDVDLLGVATLSNSEVVQNELIAHIEKLIDPEVAKYRFGVTGFLRYPGKDTQGRVNPDTTIDIDTLADSAVHIDNPFIILIGQGVVFEEDNIRYNLLPHEAVQLYTGLRSKLDYNQSIFGGNQRKLLNGVKDVLPLTNDGADIYKEDRITLNKAGVTTFLKKYGITFLQGVTTAQDNVVLSYESIMSIVVYVLRQLVVVAWPFMGELLTEDLKSGFVNALSETLKNIMETDNSLMALEDYNIAPYDVEIRAITTAGFNEAGKLIRENKLLAIVKIVPRGAVDAIELSVIVI